jgi:adenylate cyclase
MSGSMTAPTSAHTAAHMTAGMGARPLIRPHLKVAVHFGPGSGAAAQTAPDRIDVKTV